MTKQVAILKVGYTAGIYGCSNEYFNAVYFDGENLKNVLFKGMYGVEERIARVFESKGYKIVWLTNDYGRMTTRGNGKVMDGAFKYEKEAIDSVDRNA